MISFYEISALTAGLFHFALTLFVLGRDLRSSVNRVYCLWGFSLVFWNLSTFFKLHAPDERTGLFWVRMLHLGVIFLPVSLFHLYLLIGGISRPKLMRGLYAIHLTLAFSVFTPWYMRGVRMTNFGYYAAEVGPAFRAFLVSYTVIAISAMVLLYRKQRTLPPLHRTRLRSLLLANLILFLAGTHDLLAVKEGPAFYPGTSIPFHPLGNLAAIFYGIVVAYSVLQHQLLNIQITLSRLAAQLVRVLFMVLVGFILLFVLSQVRPEKFNYYSFFGALGVLLASALLVSWLFPRFFGKGEEKLERRILGDRFEYHDKVQGFIQSILWYQDRNTLFDDLHELLTGTIRVCVYQVILWDDTTRAFSVYRAFPERASTPLSDLQLDSPVFRFFQNSAADYLALDLTYFVPGQTGQERAARKQLESCGAAFCFALMSEDRPLGLFLIGEKASGEPFTLQDFQLLVSLVKNLSLVLNHIRLKNQVLVAEELELIGRMSRGMAHDLNNLLTPVSTLLQLLREDLLDRDKCDELLPVALRNVSTMQSYIREALFFSQNHTPQLEAGRLDLVIHKAVATAEPAWRRKEMDVTVNTPDEIMVEMDSVLIQRLIANLLSNAIDASPPKSKIRIELQRLARTEASRDWLRIRILDEGEGIKREHLKRIFKPYFTTKDRGDETRGFGLGLAICRQIVHLHGGNLNIASEEKKGTTVQVDLPSRQINRPAPALALNRA